MPGPKRGEYSLLTGEGASYTVWKFGAPTLHSITLWIAFSIITLLSFSFGRYTGTKPPSSIPVGTVDYIFKYNRSYAEGSERTEALWKGLFPKQNGYFSHPDIAPHRSTLSVYHQLHCLNGIREGYWVVHDIAVEGKKLNDGALPMMISPSHIRHCIDLLRQSLICNADLTIEEKDEEAGGVHGFGTSHQCKDYQQLNAWISQWERGYE